MIFLDSETCGLHSMMVLLQYAEDDGEIKLYDVWKEPVGKTLRLLEWIASQPVTGFNLVFDWFHVVKIYTVWSLLPEDWIPEQHIHEIAMREPEGQNGLCIKPVSACDLLLWSRKNQYQALMAREDIRIRRVPTQLAYALAEELERRVQIDGIYFAKSADKDAPRWRVYDVVKAGRVDQHFKDVVLKFNPAGGLKFLAEYALGYEPKYHFKDVELDRSNWPVELGYAPTALAIASPENGWIAEKKVSTRKGNKIRHGYAWPAKIQAHIDHWANNGPAREYATDDIVYTRDLYKHFGSPEPGDDDSTLACMVPVVRWRGFTINVEGMKGLREQAREKVAARPVNTNKSTDVRAYLTECMDEMEAMYIEDSTKKQKLERIAAWDFDEDEECSKCMGQGCKRCQGVGQVSKGPHPAAVRAKEILGIKFAAKEIELYDKLVKAGKLHASFNVIGTMSSRMSGGDGLNAQGIKKTKEVRCLFPFAWPGYELCGGDFDSFEVTLADAVYNDPKLREALVTKVECHKCLGSGKVFKCKPCKGKGCEKCLHTEKVECENCEGTGKATKKVHGLFGMAMFPGRTYEDILASDGSANDMYGKAKSGVFAMIYGGNADTLARNLSLSKEVAENAYLAWGKMFPGIEKARNRILQAFCSMQQPKGPGTAVIWNDPAEYCETFLGFRRYFTLENMICRALFDLSRAPPKEWKQCNVKVVRRDRIQTAAGAVSSALYGAAFQIQAANMRAAANHEIQSPGGEITKAVQRMIWDLQPAGVHPLVVLPMNVHDEILSVTRPDYVELVAQTVKKGVERFRPKVPLVGMTWNLSMANWAEKKGGSVTLKVRPPELE